MVRGRCLTASLLLLALALPLPVQAAPFWPVSAQTVQARSISWLFWLVMAIAAVFLFGVLGALLYVAIRYRGRPGQADPPAYHGNLALEFWWTAIPIALLIVVFGFMVRAADASFEIASDSLNVTVVGHQWWWEFRYPGDVVAANELHVPVGQQVRLSLQSADVVHNFWVPELAGKEQIIPGQVNIWTFTADHPGVYDGACSEYCGAQHSWMRLKVIVQSPTDFTAWLQAQGRTDGAVAQSPQYAQAVSLYSANACGACHTIAGVSSGTVGPDLSHVGSRTTLAAGAVQNTPEKMTQWLENPQQFKPGSLMPNFHLTGPQARELAALLEALQ